jgi:hypothetical protein
MQSKPRHIMSNTNSAVKPTPALRASTREVVILFGSESDPALRESKRIITNGGRRVEFKNLQTQAI